MSLFVLSFILSVSRITDDRGNGHRQNLTGMARGDPQEVFNDADLHVDVGPVFHFPQHWQIPFFNAVFSLTRG